MSDLNMWLALLQWVPGYDVIMRFAVIMLCSYVLVWVFYLAFTALEAKKDKLTPLPKAVARALLVIWAVADIVLNCGPGSLTFLQWPWRTWRSEEIRSATGMKAVALRMRALTLTYRCGWNKTALATTWRGAVARWFCEVWLDPFQLGGHCREIR